MRTTMKKRHEKGIFAAARAFTIVFSQPKVPLCAEPVTAHAACSHHCRYYGSSGNREEIENHEERSILTPVRVSTQIQYDT